MSEKKYLIVDFDNTIACINWNMFIKNQNEFQSKWSDKLANLFPEFIANPMKTIKEAQTVEGPSLACAMATSQDPTEIIKNFVFCKNRIMRLGDFFGSLKDKNIIIGLVSNGTYDNIEPLLQQIGLKNIFSFMWLNKLLYEKGQVFNKKFLRRGEYNLDLDKFSPCQKLIYVSHHNPLTNFKLDLPNYEHISCPENGITEIIMDQIYKSFGINQTIQYLMPSMPELIKHKYLILDFDCTITCIHFDHFINERKKFDEIWGSKNSEIINTNFYYDPLGAIRSNPPEPLLSKISNFIFCDNRITMLKSFFEKLIANNIFIAIASHGHPVDIGGVLKLVDLLQYFSFIFGRRTGITYERGLISNDLLVSEEFDSKKQIIEELFYKANKLIYVDDDTTTNDRISTQIKDDPRYTYIGGDNKENPELSLPLENSTGFGIGIVNKILELFGINNNIQMGGDFFYKYKKYKSKYTKLLVNKI